MYTENIVLDVPRNIKKKLTDVIKTNAFILLKSLIFFEKIWLFVIFVT
ncbi:hypothetical protein BN440_1299 [Erwinia amylovora MR1]|nr:hypothetical protein BN440_1299 [Erwinia amylovora MR1]